jgi:hypothetical protein
MNERRIECIDRRQGPRRKTGEPKPIDSKQRKQMVMRDAVMLEIPLAALTGPSDRRKAARRNT